MIDKFSLLLSHGLLLLAAWRLLHRGDLDDDRAEPDAHPVQERWDRYDVP